SEVRSQKLKGRTDRFAHRRFFTSRRQAYFNFSIPTSNFSLLTFWYSSPIVPRLRRAEMHAGGVRGDCLSVAERPASRRHDLDVVPHRRQSLRRAFRNQRFDEDVRAVEGRLREAPGLERFLDV